MNISPLLSISPEQRRGLVLVAIAAFGLSVFYISLAHGHTLSPAGQTSSEKIVDPLATPSSSIPPSVPATVVVDVAGKVKHPGVYSLVIGSRAIDAIKAAGGADAGVELSHINQAEILVDGQQLLIGASAAPTFDPRRNKTSKSATQFPIHINSANLAQFDSLPGIGPVMAKRIVDFRRQNGPFLALEDLRKVKGMGVSKFGDIKSLLTL